MIETLQNEESKAAEFFSLKLIKETKEMYVFSVNFPQASKNIYGGVQGLSLIHIWRCRRRG